jgi:hypothetical protein
MQPTLLFFKTSAADVQKHSGSKHKGPTCVPSKDTSWSSNTQAEHRIPEEARRQHATKETGKKYAELQKKKLG